MIPIFTRLHKLAGLVEAAEIPPTQNHYVIGADLIAAMPRADVQRSIAAMIEAQMARLPFPELLVEFSVEPAVTRFLWLNEAPGGLWATTIMLTSKDLATVPDRPAFVSIANAGLVVSCAPDARDAQAIALGSAFALLMLNIKGVEKQTIAPTRLNAERQRHGRAKIPTHTVLRIGIVYDRHGKPLSGAAKLKAVYLRAGHVRQQAIGKGWHDHKPVYIAPQLVNFREGDEAPQPKPRHVQMGSAR